MDSVANSVDGSRYGPRDGVSVLIGKGHRVALCWHRSKRWWVLDGQRVMLAELEDQAERYERLRYRYTERVKPSSKS